MKRRSKIFSPWLNFEGGSAEESELARGVALDEVLRRVVSAENIPGSVVGDEQKAEPDSETKRPAKKEK